jgi:hypothetical protein
VLGHGAVDPEGERPGFGRYRGGSAEPLHLGLAPSWLPGEVASSLLARRTASNDGAARKPTPCAGRWCCRPGRRTARSSVHWGSP